MQTRFWKYAPGANCAEPITPREARNIAWQGMDGVLVVQAYNESDAYRRACAWAGLEDHDDVGGLGLEWFADGSGAYLIEYV